MESCFESKFHQISFCTFIFFFFCTEPEIIWYCNGAIIKPSRYFQMGYQDSIASLIINEVFPEDEGTYTCEAVNDLGSNVSHSHLKVQGALSETESLWWLKFDVIWKMHDSNSSLWPAHNHCLFIYISLRKVWMSCETISGKYGIKFEFLKH